ncbi:protein phosphatase 2C domain-containing protein [Actinoallomurus vinaceus]|uniref:Protein phosphatase 2C domain-containing protein n=1 Tax=Actinoallomurus vinaceus TaxID=1080074 RepID=A0ABP8UQ05_9ACTN
MRTSVATFSTHKDGGAAADYEDAAASNPSVPDDDEVPGEQITVAVADGASESLLAGRWARLLVEEFSQAEPLTDGSAFAAIAIRAAKRWRGVYTTYVDERLAGGRPIRWYEEPGLARGAYATLLVAHFTESGGWNAAALGDSCLFQVRDNHLHAAFPLQSDADFSIRPDLLGSRDPDAELIAERATLISGVWEQGDQFFLCTDALAAWFLAAHASGEAPWAVLGDLGTDAGPGNFDSWVTGLRINGRMRNDDVTLVRVHMW